MTTQTEMELPPAPPHVPAVLSSATSVAAAKSVAPHASRLEAIVLAAITAAPATGRTCDEIEVSEVMSHQTTSARCRALVLRGAIQDSGMKRKTRSGRLATVWVRAQ